MSVAYCRFCGKSLINATDRFCRECGGDQNEVQPVKSIIAATVRSTEALQTISQGYPSALICANCDCADVRSVASIHKEGNVSGVSEGTAQTRTYVPGDTHHTGHINYGSVRTTTAVSITSDLASLLAPPHAPTAKIVSDDHSISLYAAFLTIGVLVGLGYFLFGISHQPVDFLFCTILLLLLASLACWGIQTMWSREEKACEQTRASAVDTHRQACEIYQTTMQVWSRMHYCGRCDCVTDPETNAFAQSSCWRVLCTD